MNCQLQINSLIKRVSELEDEGCGCDACTIERTSELINDGADNTSIYVEIDELSLVAFSNNYEDLLNQPVISNPSGLEAINEGNGIGWRLTGRDPNNYGNIGGEAIDFSTRFSRTVNTGGAIGYQSFAHGEDSTATSYSDFVTGYYNTTNAATNGQRFMAGGSSDMVGSEGGATIGLALRNTNSWGHVVVGTANLDVGGSGTGNINNPVDPIFTVGNGTYTTPPGRFLPSVPSNAFQVVKGGEIFAPSLTIAKINAAANNVMTTKEWVLAQIGGGGLPYTTYVALLNQSGTGDPTALVLENTTGGTIVWTRDAGGDFTATLTGATFTSTKTWCLVEKGSEAPGLTRCFRNSDTILKLQNYDTTGSAVDSLTGASIEIRIYP